MRVWAGHTHPAPGDHRDIVEAHADFLLPPAESLELLGDKSRFYRYCIEQNLPIPATRFITSNKELEAAAHEMHFPLVIKPPRRAPEWMRSLYVCLDYENGRRFKLRFQYRR